MLGCSAQVASPDVQESFLDKAVPMEAWLEQVTKPGRGRPRKLTPKQDQNTDAAVAEGIRSEIRLFRRMLGLKYGMG